MGKYQTKTQVLYDILMDDLKEEIELSKERLVILSDDVESSDVENSYLKSLMRKHEILTELINSAEGSSSSRPTVVTTSFLSKYSEPVSVEEWTSDLLEGEHDYYIETGFKLKDYNLLDINKIYIFENLYVRFDGEVLLTKYSLEEFWYEMDVNGEYFNTWKERGLFETGVTI